MATANRAVPVAVTHSDNIMKAITTKNSAMIVGCPIRSYCLVPICHPPACGVAALEVYALPQRFQGTAPIEQYRPVGSYSLRTAAIDHARQLAKTPTHEANETRVT
jgi:hypothetical protein